MEIAESSHVFKVFLAGSKHKLSFFFKQFIQVEGLLFKECDDLADSHLVIAYQERISTTQPMVHIPSEIEDITLKNLSFSTEQGAVCLSEDLVEGVFFWLSHQGEKGSVSYGNYKDEEYFQNHSYSFSYPYLNKAFAVFKSAIISAISKKQFLLSRSRHPYQKQFSLVLTHDIDYLDKRIINRLKMFRNVLKLLKNNSIKKAHWWELIKFIINPYPISFEVLKDIEASHNTSSVLNFCAYNKQMGDKNKDVLLNPAYALKEASIEHLTRFFEIGIHGSTKAFDNASRYEQELNDIRLRANCVGTRQHMLSFHFDDTFRLQEDNDIKYDTSIGFNDFNGYRSNAAFPYQIGYDEERQFALREYPLVLMDSVFTKQGVFKSKKILNYGEQLVSVAKELGNFSGSVCWHDSAFYKNSTLAKAYSDLLTLFQDSGGYLGTPLSMELFYDRVSQITVEQENVLVSQEPINGGVMITTISKDGEQSLGKLDGVSNKILKW